MDKLWFKANCFGWGWTPCSIEGWLVTIGFVVGLLLISVFLNDGNVSSYIAWFLSLLALIFIIGYKKGEKPHWSWGRRKDKEG